jgi:hypothetical protein
MVKRLTTNSIAEIIFLIVVVAYTIFMLCTTEYIQQSSGVMVVFSLAITLSEKLDPMLLTDIQVRY